MTRGIVAAHAAGVLSSTSMLANMPGFGDAVRAARRIAGDRSLGVGLHLNLVQGPPLSYVPSLTDARTGRFHSLASLVVRALTGRVDPDDVRAECVAQIGALRSAGIAITHLDSHMHVHALPHVWRPVAEIARETGIRAVRWPAESLRVGPLSPARLCVKTVVASSWWIARRRAPVMASPDHFIGMTLQGGKHLEPRLLKLLDALRPGVTELMLHPGYVDADLEAIDSYTWQRERELAALMSPAVKQRLRRGDIELVHFGALC
ncbi:MAG TPA: ChbG/HpnK family deacetylase [Gemmatimonadaceae bacterium]